ncbi:MAG: DUF3047 domain-containing protein [Nitrospirales bacterium]
MTRAWLTMVCVLGLYGLSPVPGASTPSTLAHQEQLLKVGEFSSAEAGGSLPQGWKPLTFEKISEHTRYELVNDGGQVVVKATSHQSSSGLTREITINPRDYPVVEWHWKVQNILEGGDVTKKSGDDYPARLYITFEYDSSKVGFFEKVKYETIKLIYGQYPPIGAINYIWESTSPVGTVTPNPYTDRVHMFVIESGHAKLNQWVTEERNILEDYRMAFGENPPNISGVAIMADTDNTKESAVSYFGDIVFKPLKENAPAH